MKTLDELILARKSNQHELRRQLDKDFAYLLSLTNGKLRVSGCVLKSADYRLPKLVIRPGSHFDEWELYLRGMLEPKILSTEELLERLASEYDLS